MPPREADAPPVDLAIIGGGPAGLTAAYEYQAGSDGAAPIVFEASDLLGGIARTESHNGFRFDIGGHRFFTKVTEVEAMWHEVMGEEMIRVSRSSRIYYRGKFYDYPLNLFNALSNIGPYESVRILLSYIKWQLKRDAPEESFEDWVMKRLAGGSICTFSRATPKRSGAFTHATSRRIGRPNGSRTCPLPRLSGTRFPAPMTPRA
jgi:protoporphyrinogen oxidase